jgi:hypothetical protein
MGTSNVIVKRLTDKHYAIIYRGVACRLMSPRRSLEVPSGLQHRDRSPLEAITEYLGRDLIGQLEFVHARRHRRAISLPLTPTADVMVYLTSFMQ